MQAFSEVSIDLTAQELLASAGPVHTGEPGRMSALDPARPTASQPAHASSTLPQPVACDDTVEIELTAEQMDALLSGVLP